MEKNDFSQGFKKLDLTEQATFVLLGGINTVFNTLTNTFIAVKEASDSFADFCRPGASETLGKKSLESIFNVELKTDFVVRQRDPIPTAATAVPVKPAAKPTAVPIKAAPVAKKEDAE